MSAGWPDFLRMPASEAVPILSENWPAIRFGFALMFLANILWFPAIWCLARVLFKPGSKWVDLALNFALASLAIRGLWYGVALTMFPVLIDLWPNLDAASIGAVDAFYIFLNDILSTVQEDIGLNLLGGFAGVILCILLLRHRKLPIWIAVMGLTGNSLLIVSSAEMIGLNAGDLVALLAPSLMGFWLIFAGIFLAVRGPQVSRRV